MERANSYSITKANATEKKSSNLRLKRISKIKEYLGIGAEKDLPVYLSTLFGFFSQESKQNKGLKNWFSDRKANTPLEDILNFEQDEVKKWIKKVLEEWCFFHKQGYQEDLKRLLQHPRESLLPEDLLKENFNKQVIRKLKKAPNWHHFIQPVFLQRGRGISRK